MRITLKLYAGLAEYLPAGAVANATEVEVSGDDTPWTVIDRFKVPRARAHLVLINGTYVPPAERADRRFRDGDALAIWPPVAGG